MPLVPASYTSIFESRARALVNPVNCRGVMGAGLAKAFREQYPGLEYAYKRACTSKTLFLGTCHGEPTRLFTWPRTKDQAIICLPTKDHWTEHSRLDGVTAGLLALRTELLAREWGSVALPMLGCGLGGLNREDVRAQMELVFLNTPILVEVYP